MVPLRGWAGSDLVRSRHRAVGEPAVEQYGYRIGQRLDIGVYSIDQWNDPAFFSAPTPPVRTGSVTIVGLGLFPDEVVHDDGDRTQQLLLTPALSRTIAAYATHGVQGLQLTDGVEALRAAANAGLTPGAQEFHAVAVDAERARRALRPLSTTVVVGLVVGVPSGIVRGSWVLSVFAGQLHVVVDPTVPVTIVVVVVVALVVANLAAFAPARAARSVRTDRRARAPVSR